MERFAQATIEEMLSSHLIKRQQSTLLDLWVSGQVSLNERLPSLL
jgi:hypothetical protein